MTTYTPEQLAQAYELGYQHGINRKPPLPPEVVGQLYETMEQAKEATE